MGRVVVLIGMVLVATASLTGMSPAEAGSCNFIQESFFVGPYAVCQNPTTPEQCTELGQTDLNHDAVYSAGPCDTTSIVGTCLTSAPDNGPDTAIVYYEGEPAMLEITCGFQGGFWSVPSETDADGDGWSDETDNCPTVPNFRQTDFDGDGQGNACDSDDDNDGVPDDTDAFPLDPNETQDTDGDGLGNNADNCPSDANEDQIDTDTDGQGNVCDNDDDNDGVPDASDAFPLNPDESADSDGDSVGNNGDAFPNDRTRHVASSITLVDDREFAGWSEAASLGTGAFTVPTAGGNLGAHLSVSYATTSSQSMPVSPVTYTPGIDGPAIEAVTFTADILGDSESGIGLSESLTFGVFQDGEFFSGLKIDNDGSKWTTVISGALQFSCGSKLGSRCPDFSVSGGPISFGVIANSNLDSDGFTGYLVDNFAVALVMAARFGDVPTDHWAYEFIETLATSGITSGCGNGNYCPGNPVTRAQCVS